MRTGLGTERCGGDAMAEVTTAAELATDAHRDDDSALGDEPRAMPRASRWLGDSASVSAVPLALDMRCGRILA